MAEEKPKRARRTSIGGRKTAAKAPAKAPAKKPAAKKAAAPAATAAKKASTPKASDPKGKKAAAKPAPDLPARIDGLRGWLDQIERRQGRMTYLATAGILIALACGGVALYMGIKANQDMAKKSDLDAVKAQISKTSTDAQSQINQKVQDIDNTINSLKQQVAAAQQQATQAKQQASQAQAQAPAQFTPATPKTPGTGTGTGTGTGGAGQ